VGCRQQRHAVLGGLPASPGGEGESRSAPCAPHVSTARALTSHLETADRVREAGRSVGLDGTGISSRARIPTGDTKRVQFAGSPTILLDGLDLFPAGEPVSELMCRVYATPTSLAGLPTTERIIEAMGSHGR
jgi:hypothetical protein